MKENIESGTEWIENPVDLNLDLDNLDFETVQKVEFENNSDVEVFDLEVDTQHNYIVDGVGIVHNGGGK
jgi:intein/homing endonuclease